MPVIRLLIDTTSADGREEVRGISRYSREHGSWKLELETHKLFSSIGLRNFNGEPDGVIARVINVSLADRCRAFGPIPIVNLAESKLDLPWPTVVTDIDAIAEVAIDHLLEGGYRNIAFSGYEGQYFSRMREDAVARSLARRGLELLTASGRTPLPKDAVKQGSDFLARWLLSLPPATGIICCNDWRGLDALQACSQNGIDVPGRLGVIGIDNDDVLADAAHVSLSSVDIGSFAAGYEAARLLDAWMSGRPPDKKLNRIDQVKLSPRESTAALLVADPIVRDALLMMREPAAWPKSVEAMLEHLPISRRPFEKRFRAAIGRSPYQELMACRIREAERLLMETDQSVAEIAERCGFTQQHHFSTAFKSAKGCTPTDFRRDRQASRTARGFKHHPT